MLRKIALVTAKIALVYTIAGATIITTNHDLQIWQVEYDGQIYEYVSDRYDNPNAYIIDLDGNKIYVTAILGGDTE